MTVTTPTQGTVCNPNAKASPNQCIKSEVSSFSRSGHIFGGSKKLNGSRDHNHAPFGDDFFICLVRLDIAYQYLCTKFDSSGLSRSLDMDGCLKFTRGSAMAEGLRDALVSRNSATTKHPI